MEHFELAQQSWVLKDHFLSSGVKENTEQKLLLKKKWRGSERFLEEAKKWSPQKVKSINPMDKVFCTKEDPMTSEICGLVSYLQSSFPRS